MPGGIRAQLARHRERKLLVPRDSPWRQQHRTVNELRAQLGETLLPLLLALLFGRPLVISWPRSLSTLAGRACASSRPTHRRKSGRELLRLNRNDDTDRVNDTKKTM